MPALVRVPARSAAEPPRLRPWPPPACPPSPVPRPSRCLSAARPLPGLPWPPPDAPLRIAAWPRTRRATDQRPPGRCRSRGGRIVLAGCLVQVILESGKVSQGDPGEEDKTAGLRASRGRCYREQFGARPFGLAVLAERVGKPHTLHDSAVGATELA